MMALAALDPSYPVYPTDTIRPPGYAAAIPPPLPAALQAA